MNLHIAQRGAQAAARNRAAMAKSGTTSWGTALWTDSEEELLRTHYPDYDRLCDLLPKRSRKAIRTRCDKLDISHSIKWWTGREISMLRRLWTSGMPRAELLEVFQGCSWKSISRAAESREFKRPRRRYVKVPSAAATAVRDRCFELNYRLKDVDALAKTNKYFQQGSTYRPRPDIKRIDRAVRALDGKLVVTWNDGD
jgi:hypothetical protein